MPPLLPVVRMVAHMRGGQMMEDMIAIELAVIIVAMEYKSHRLLVTDLANTWNLCKWLSEKVDRFGQPIEEE